MAVIWPQGAFRDRIVPFRCGALPTDTCLSACQQLLCRISTSRRMESCSFVLTGERQSCTRSPHANCCARLPEQQKIYLLLPCRRTKSLLPPGAMIGPSEFGG